MADATAQALAAIWREVLGVAAVGVDDNFFDLGGTSLRLAEVQALVRRTLGLEVSMVEMFRIPPSRRSPRICGSAARPGRTTRRR